MKAWGDAGSAPGTGPAAATAGGAISARWRGVGGSAQRQRGIAAALLKRGPLGGQPLGKRAGLGVKAGEQGRGAERHRALHIAGRQPPLELGHVAVDAPAKGVALQLGGGGTGQRTGAVQHLAQVAPRLAVAVLGPEQRCCGVAAPSLAAEGECGEQLAEAVGRQRVYLAVVEEHFGAAEHLQAHGVPRGLLGAGGRGGGIDHGAPCCRLLRGVKGRWRYRRRAGERRLVQPVAG